MTRSMRWVVCHLCLGLAACSSSGSSSETGHGSDIEHRDGPGPAPDAVGTDSQVVGHDTGGSGAVVTYGKTYAGGQYHLGPVDWDETQWHNACAPDPSYAPAVRVAEGDLLAGLWNGIPDVESYCDACIYITTGKWKTALLRVVTYGATTSNSIDVSAQAYALLDSGEYPRSMSWQFANGRSPGDRHLPHQRVGQREIGGQKLRAGVGGQKDLRRVGDAPLQPRLGQLEIGHLHRRVRRLGGGDSDDHGAHLPQEVHEVERGAVGARIAQDHDGGASSGRTMGRGSGTGGGTSGVIGSATIGGAPPSSLDRVATRRVLRNRTSEVMACHRSAASPRPSCKLTLRLVITSEERVRSSRVARSTCPAGKQGPPKWIQCVLETTRRWVFPRPSDGRLTVLDPVWVFN